MNRTLPERIRGRLAQPLSGPVVGTRFEPRPRLWRHYDRIPEGARQAAVLVLLYPHEDRWHLPLTLRRSHLTDHAGQVSLPGGAIESGETATAAALREFHEELGAAGHPIEFLGALSPLYVHVSNFRIEPIVATTFGRPPMIANPEEVEQLFEVPLVHLLDPANFGCHCRHDRQGASYEAPHFAWPGHYIWGATCMILGQLLTLLEELGEVA